MIRLGLLRHGHTEWNRAGRIQGASDIPLDPNARAQLAAQRLPAGWDAATLYASPLHRAVETAELVAGHAPQIAPALREMSWGEWEGQRGADLLEAATTPRYRHIEDWGWDYRPPAGESPADLRARLLPWLDTLTGEAVLVTHIGVMRVLLALAHGWDFSGAAPFAVKRNRLFVVDYEAGVLRPGTPPVVRLEARA